MQTEQQALYKIGYCKKITGFCSLWAAHSTEEHHSSEKKQTNQKIIKSIINSKVLKPSFPYIDLPDDPPPHFKVCQHGETLFSLSCGRQETDC